MSEPARASLRRPRRLPAGLAVVLGGCLLLVAARAPAPMLGVAALSAVLIAIAPWVSHRRWLCSFLLLAGAVPIAVLTWWTVVVPLIAALALITGLLGVKRSRRRVSPISGTPGAGWPVLSRPDGR